MDDPWSHYLTNDVAVSVVESSKDKHLLQRFSTTENTTTNQTWNQSSIELNITNTMTVQTLQCLNDSIDDSYTVESSTTNIAIPRRNLAGAFDDLYVDEPTMQTTPAASKQLTLHEDSPTGVADLESPEDEAGDASPHFSLHEDLKRELSQDLVNRVSFYGIVHDINKEATAMAANDFCPMLRQVKSTDEADEVFSPLIVAVQGHPSTPRQTHTMVDMALIDEERWLLGAIESRGSRLTEAGAVCPPTFLQAMGEREYENPLSSMETSRTQLWKPSRSWWEAKSGKNPWIEPKSHNKRWR